MDIYQRKADWKIILSIVAVLIISVTTYYSLFLAQSLKESEDKNKEIYYRALKDLLENEDPNADMTTQSEIQLSFALPVIIKYDDGSYTGVNWSDKLDNDQEYLKKQVDRQITDGVEPLDYPAGDGQIFIFNSKLVRLIRFYPIIQTLLVSLFIALGYYLFNTARRAEQNRVWAGLAKETAHQLGTPISAIMAWIEYLREVNSEDPDQLEVLKELDKDVERLELIADRFSKIGSAPELEKTNVHTELENIKDYMQRRASRHVTFSFPDPAQERNVMVNRHLFSWVLENLIRNSLDAMDASGEVSASVYEEEDMVCIDLSDTGKGIPAGKFKTVFQPGYSTKQRGWGLGLSLAKRIIEYYHNGKIYVKSSKIDEGTTFTIKVPKA